MVATPYALIPLFTGLILAASLAFTWQRRFHPVALPVGVLLGSLFIWVVGYGFEIVLVSPAATLVMAQIQYIGIITTVPALLATGLFVIRRESSIRRSQLIAYAAYAVTMLVGVWTNQWHGGWWPTVEADLDSPFPELQMTHGPSRRVLRDASIVDGDRSFERIVVKTTRLVSTRPCR